MQIPKRLVFGNFSTTIKEMPTPVLTITLFWNFFKRTWNQTRTSPKWNSLLCSHFSSSPLSPHHQPLTSRSWKTTTPTTETPTTSRKCQKWLKVLSEQLSQKFQGNYWNASDYNRKRLISARWCWSWSDEFKIIEEKSRFGSRVDWGIPTSFVTSCALWERFESR